MKLNKKILVSVPLILSMGLNSNLAFAKDEIKTSGITAIEQKEIEQKDLLPREDFQLFTRFEGNIKDLINFQDGPVIKVEDKDKIKSFLIDSDILILDKKGNILKDTKDILKLNNKVAIYYIGMEENTSKDTKATVLIEINQNDEDNKDDIKGVHVDFFTMKVESMGPLYISLDKTLDFYTSEKTEIIDKKGEKYTGTLENKILLVQYDIATLSIPAFTTPSKIIVLDDLDKSLKDKIELFIKEENRKEEIEINNQINQMKKVVNNIDIKLKEADKKEKITKAIVNGKNIDIEIKYNEKDTPLVPLRVIVEATENILKWDSKEQKIYIGEIVSFNLSKDAYFVGKNGMKSLGTAPKNFDGINYVPLSLFTEILNLNMEIDNDTIILSNEIIEKYNNEENTDTDILEEDTNVLEEDKNE